MSRRAELADLREGQRVDGVRLLREEATALNSTKLVSVQPDERGWCVTAAHAVGVLRCGDLVVRVQPKVGAVQALRLLARAHGIRGLVLDDAIVGVADEADLNTVLARMFVAEASRALAAGPLRGYRSEDHSLATLRGRVRLRDQELRRFGQLVPLEVTFDEWTMDTDENRLIRSACQRLLRLPDLPVLTRRQLLSVDRMVPEARVLPHGSRPPPWTSTRLNHRLHQLLKLAELVLAQRTIEHRVGDISVHGFVLSMAWLFEKLVAEILVERRGGVVARAQVTTSLDTRNELVIKPDLVFQRDGRIVGVADTKYKILDESGRFPNADAYQLVTYCARLGLGSGHLMYAAGEPCPDPYDIMSTGVRLIVHAVDLAQPVSQIESQVLNIGRSIVERSDVAAGKPTPKT